MFAFLSSEAKPFILKLYPPNRTLLLSINFSVNALVLVNYGMAVAAYKKRQDASVYQTYQQIARILPLEVNRIPITGTPNSTARRMTYGRANTEFQNRKLGTGDS